MTIVKMKTIYDAAKRAKTGSTIQCPHCGGKIKLIMEGKHFSKRHGQRVQFARGMCINNDPFKGKDRCLYKTTASELNEVKTHLNKIAR